MSSAAAGHPARRGHRGQPRGAHRRPGRASPGDVLGVVDGDVVVVGGDLARGRRRGASTGCSAAAASCVTVVDGRGRAARAGRAPSPPRRDARPPRRRGRRSSTAGSRATRCCSGWSERGRPDATTASTELRRRPDGHASSPRPRDLHTVGDLLAFLPAPLPRPGELTDLGTLREGEDAVVVADGARARRPGRCGSAAARCSTVVVTDGTHDIDARPSSSPAATRSELVPGRARASSPARSALPTRRWQLDAPRLRAARPRRRRRRRRGLRRRLVADLPRRRAKLDYLDHHRVRSRIVLDQCSTSVADPLPAEVRARAAAGRRCARRCGCIHLPRTGGRRRARRGARLRYDEAFVAAGGARPAAAGSDGVRDHAAPCRVPGGLLDGFDARLPFELTAGQRGRRRGDRRRAGPRRTRCTGCCRARSARARPSSRCGRCSRSSTPAARPRCWRRPRCSPRSTTARSRAMLGDLAEGGMLGGAERRHPGRAAHRQPVDRRRRQQALLDVGPGDAGIVDRHPRAAPGARVVLRPRPGRRRRAAPVRRRAARRVARQGRTSRRTCWS